MLVPPLRPPAYQRTGSAPSRGTTRAAPALSPAAPAPETPPAPAPPGGWPLDAEPSPEEAALFAREQAFDMQLRLRAEMERESNALRDLFQEQMKQDDEFLKKCIAMI